MASRLEKIKIPIIISICPHINGQKSISKIAKNLDSTFSHVVKVLQTMQDMNIVSSVKMNRKKIYKFTKIGEKYERHATGLLQIINDNEHLIKK